MPPTAPSAAAAPAAVPAAPVTPPVAPQTPPATPAPATPPADPKATGRGSRLFSMLAAEADVPPGTKPEDRKPVTPPAAPAPDGKDPKAAAPGATPETPAATPGDDKPVKATKKSPISKRPELPIAKSAAEPTPAAAPAATPAPAKPDTDWEAGLVDEEKQLIEEAAEAEKFLPARKGLAEQAKKFVREHQKYLEKHPDLDDPDEKAAYEAWLTKNRPALTVSEQQQVTESRIAAKVSKPFEQKTADLEHQLFVRDQEPVLKQQTQRVASEMNLTAIPAEIMEFAQKYGVDEAKKQFGDELRVVNSIVSTAASDHEELIRLDTFHPTTRRPLSTPAENPSDPKFAQHQRLLKIVEQVDNDFKENAKQGELLRDGKWFVTREEWAALPASARGQYWHFTNREIATRMLNWVKPAVDMAITNNRQELEARGYVRREFKPPAAATPPATPPQPTRTPAGPGASPVPAPTPGQPGPATAGSRIASALAGD